MHCLADFQRLWYGEQSTSMGLPGIRHDQTMIDQRFGITHGLGTPLCLRSCPNMFHVHPLT